MVDLDEPAQSWGDVLGFAQVMVAVVWSRLQWYRPSVRRAWEERWAQEATAYAEAVQAEYEQGLATKYGDRDHLSTADRLPDGTIRASSMDARFTERQEVAANTLMTAWRGQLEEALGESLVEFRVQFATAPADA